MKVNRFGVSQRIFLEMFSHWYNVQSYKAQTLRILGEKEKAMKLLDDADLAASKTLIGEEPFEMREFRELSKRLRAQISKELSDQQELSVPSS